MHVNIFSLMHFNVLPDSITGFRPACANSLENQIDKSCVFSFRTELRMYRSFHHSVELCSGESKQLFTSLQLLDNHANCPYHGEPPCAQLQILHLEESLRISGLQAERIEAVITGHFSIPDRPPC